MIRLKRSCSSWINPKRLAPDSLEEGRNVEVFKADGETKTEYNFGHSRIADRHHVQFCDLPIAVNIAILNISSHIFPKILTGRIGYFCFIYKKTFCYISPLLA